jgi:hypothetical protein
MKKYEGWRNANIKEYDLLESNLDDMEKSIGNDRDYSPGSFSRNHKVADAYKPIAEYLGWGEAYASGYGNASVRYLLE